MLINHWEALHCYGDVLYRYMRQIKHCTYVFEVMLCILDLKVAYLVSMSTGTNFLLLLSRLSQFKWVEPSS